MLTSEKAENVYPTTINVQIAWLRTNHFANSPIKCKKYHRLN